VSSSVAQGPTRVRRGIIQLLLALSLALSLLMAGSSGVAQAHSKGSNFCGFNHWYGAYRHYIESSTYWNGEVLVCWFSSLGGIGGGKYHSTSVCPD
jgi:hypothetical protein